LLSQEKALLDPDDTLKKARRPKKKPMMTPEKGIPALFVLRNHRGIDPALFSLVPSLW
jgi:hypothetical protein